MHQVRGRIRVRITSGDARAPPGTDLGQARLTHEPFHAFAAGVDAFTPEDGVHAE